MKIYMADFETRAGEKAIEENKTYVWAWGLMELFNPDNVITGNTIKNFINICSRLGDSLIYFHNLKFDGNFIVDYLLRNGYKHVTERKLGKGEFSTVISESGVWYEVKFCTGYRNTITVHDSLKKLPFNVRQLGKAFNTKKQKLELEYEDEREERHVMSAEEIEYLANDIAVVREALEIQYNEGMEKMTIGSDCLNTFIEMFGGKEKFRKWFPVLDSHEDAFVRKSYKGGWCYVNKKGHFTGVNGYTADVNSLYPSMMHSMSGNVYPYGKGIYYEGCYQPIEGYPLFVQRIVVEFELKPGYLPTVQVKGSPLYPGNEWIAKTVEPLEITLTSVDLELLFEHYDIISIRYVDGYAYQAGKGFFDEYINKFMEIKMNSKGAIRTLAKLFLNNLYGKFAMKIEQADKIPYMGNDNKLHFRIGELQPKPGVYIPVGAFVTAYSRRFTITAAQKNFEIFCYADTDSIHCIDEPKGITIDDVHLCAWKLESRWTEANFVRQKTYAERLDLIGPGEFWDLKCAGMDDESKKEFLHMINRGEKTIEDFNIGLVIKGKKLRPTQAIGGVILTPTDYTMNRNNFICRF